MRAVFVCVDTVLCRLYATCVFSFSFFSELSITSLGRNHKRRHGRDAGELLITVRAERGTHHRIQGGSHGGNPSEAPHSCEELKEL